MLTTCAPNLKVTTENGGVYLEYTHGPLLVVRGEDKEQKIAVAEEVARRWNAEPCLLASNAYLRKNNAELENALDAANQDLRPGQWKRVCDEGVPPPAPEGVFRLFVVEGPSVRGGHHVAYPALCRDGVTPCFAAYMTCDGMVTLLTDVVRYVELPPFPVCGE
jgi:hypothetical protein